MSKHALAGILGLALAMVFAVAACKSASTPTPPDKRPAAAL